jgi:hypothetical protein
MGNIVLSYVGISIVAANELKTEPNPSCHYYDYDRCCYNYHLLRSHFLNFWLLKPIQISLHLCKSIPFLVLPLKPIITIHHFIHLLLVLLLVVHEGLEDY